VGRFPGGFLRSQSDRYFPADWSTDLTVDGHHLDPPWAVGTWSRFRRSATAA